MPRSKYNLQNKNKKSSFFKELISKHLRLILIVIFLSLAVILFNSYSGKELRKHFDFVVTKSYSYSSSFVYWLKSKIKYGKKIILSADLNEKLEEENLYLKGQLLELEILKRENEELKKVVSYFDNREFKFITTRIIALNADFMGSKLVINVGSENGVKKGDIVINNEGMIGRIGHVSDHSARVISIVNGSLKIPVLFLSSDLQCIVGEPNSDNMIKILYKKDKEKEPIIGENVVTSGIDSSIPFGIKVGNVIAEDNGKILLKPSVDFSSLETVSVLHPYS